MGRLRVFIATSLDGYIADRAGGLDWLTGFDADALGSSAFLEGVGTIVMGRSTFEIVKGFGIGWPYGQRPGLIVSSTPLWPDLGAGDPVHPEWPQVRRWAGDLPGLVDHLRGSTVGDIWVDGGGRLIAGLLDLNAIDRMDVFILPVLLGDGIRLFPPRPSQSQTVPRPARWTLVESHRFTAPGTEGVVRLTYDSVRLAEAPA